MESALPPSRRCEARPELRERPRITAGGRSPPRPHCSTRAPGEEPTSFRLDCRDHVCSPQCPQGQLGITCSPRASSASAAALGKHQPRPCQQCHDFSPGTPCRLCCLHPWAQGQGRGTRRGHSTPSCCCFPAAQSSSAEDAEPQIQPGRAQAAGWGRCCRALLGLTGGQDQRHPLGSSRIWVPNIQLHHQRSCCHLEQPRAGLEESGGKGSGKRPYRNEQLEWETDEKPLLTNKEPDKRQGSLKGLTKV